MANFKNTIFLLKANFDGVTFSQKPNFEGTTFSGIAIFDDATFFQGVAFSRVKFLEPAFFGKTHFTEKTSFLKTEFRKETDFVDATFLQGVEFVGVSFNGQANFQEATFDGIADFCCAFKQDVKFFKVRFRKAVFSGSDFHGMVEFSESHFEGDADFAGVIFKETCERANFNDVVFHNETNFSASYYQNTKMDFTGTTFKGRTLFTPYFPSDSTQGIEFGPVTFNTVNFLGQTIFQAVDLSQCSFLNSNIDKVDFRNCKFGEKEERLFGIIPSPRQNVLRDEKDCDKEVGTALVAVRERTGASPVPTGKKREGYEPVHRLYLELKRNFEDKKDWNTAGDFHFGEMECRRRMKEGWLRRNILSLEALYYWASGYGERPWRALACIVGLIPFCMFFYWLFDFATGYSINPPTTDSVNAVPTTASQVNQPSHGLGYWFWYSLKAAFLWRFGESVAEPSSVFGKGVLFLESILGPLFIALFILALRRKVKR